MKQARRGDGDLLDGESEKTQEPRRVNIGGKATVWMGKGDRLLIETPGGGGWGLPEAVERELEEQEDLAHVKAWAARGSLAEREAAQAGF